jgi:hypothetical protein
MPTSTYSQITTVVKYLTAIMPSSLLDIGVGNGKFGFIARDFLDVMLGERYHKDDWKIKIDGIEVFEKYIQDHQKSLYDEIFIGDAYDVIDGLGQYDVIYLGDVLEHIEKDRAYEFLEKCANHCNRFIILSIPLGEKWIQPEIYGNPHEEHLSFWSSEEFEEFTIEKSFLDFPNIGQYGTFLISPENLIHYRLREKASALFEEGKETESILYLKERLSELPPNLESNYLLADFYLRKKNLQGTIDQLKLTQEMFPQEPSVKEFLEQVTTAAGV